MAVEGVGAVVADIAGGASGAAIGADAVGTVIAAGAEYGLASALSGKRPKMPPNPLLSQQQTDEQVQATENEARQRQAIAGGIQSTIGPTGGQGAMLNPANMGQKSLLGQ